MTTPEEKRVKQLKVRNEVIKELVATEQKYVEDLSTIVELYVTPLKTTKSNLIQPKDLHSIFSNIQLLLNVNKELLKDLTKVAEIPLEQQIVGEIFLKLADYLKMYNQYCGNQGKALNIVEELKRTKNFNQFLDEALMDPRSHGQPLNSFLIKPIQRICRYPLLLKELLKNTPDNHVDFESLTAALTKVTEVVTEVNESQRKGENIQKILEIQNLMEQPQEFSSFKLLEPGRKFLQELTLIKQPSGKQKKYYMFNDILIYGRPSPTKKGGFIMRGFISFEKANIRDPSPGSLLIEIEKLDVNKTIQLKAEKAEEKTQLFKNLADVLDNMEKRRKEKENMTNKIQQLDPTELLARKEDEISELHKKINEIQNVDEKQFKDLRSLIDKSLESYKKRVETQKALELLQYERLVLLDYQRGEQLFSEAKAARKKEKKIEKKKEDDRRSTQEERKAELEDKDDSDQLKGIKVAPLNPNLWNKPFPVSIYQSLANSNLIASHVKLENNTPEIVLIGEQGCGKSSLLEALVGIPFNLVGKGKTKRPLFVHLVNDLKCEEVQIIFKQDTLLGIEETLVKLQQVSEELSKRNQTLSHEPIVLLLKSKYYWDMTFIDTPGLIAKRTEDIEGGEETRTETGESVKGDDKTVQKMVSRLIRPTNRLIVALEESKDWKTNSLEHFVRKVDGNLSRSLFVFSKFHLLCHFISNYEELNKLSKLCPGDIRNSYFVSLFSNKLRNRLSSSNSVDDFRDKVQKADARDLQTLNELRYDQTIGYNVGILPLLSRLLDYSWQKHKDNIPQTTEIVIHKMKECQQNLNIKQQELQLAEKTLKLSREMRVARLRETCSQYLQNFFLKFHEVIDGAFPIRGDLAKLWEEWDVEVESGASSWSWNSPLWDKRLMNGGAQLQSLSSAFRVVSNQLEIKLNNDEVKMISVYMKQTNELILRASQLAQQKFRQVFEGVIDELIKRGVYIMTQLINLVDYHFRVQQVKKHGLNNSLHLCLTVRDIFLEYVNQKAHICRDKCLKELKAHHLIFWELSSGDRELFTTLKKASLEEIREGNNLDKNQTKKDTTKRLSHSLRNDSEDTIGSLNVDSEMNLNKRVVQRYIETCSEQVVRKRDSNVVLPKRESAMNLIRREESTASMGSRISIDDTPSIDDWHGGMDNSGEERVVGLAYELFVEIRKRMSRNVLLKFHEFFLLPITGRKAQLIGELQQVIGGMDDYDIEKLFSIEDYFRELKENIQKKEEFIKLCSERLSTLVEVGEDIAKLKSNPLNVCSSPTSSKPNPQ